MGKNRVFEPDAVAPLFVNYVNFKLTALIMFVIGFHIATKILVNMVFIPAEYLHAQSLELFR